MLTSALENRTRICCTSRHLGTPLGLYPPMNFYFSKLYLSRQCVLSLSVLLCFLFSGCGESRSPDLSLNFEFGNCLGDLGEDLSCSTQVFRPINRGNMGCWLISSEGEEQPSFTALMRWNGNSFAPSANLLTAEFPFSEGDLIDMSLFVFETEQTEDACRQLNNATRCDEQTDCRLGIRRSSLAIRYGEVLSFQNDAGQCDVTTPQVTNVEVCDEIDNDCDGRVDEAPCERTEECAEGDIVLCETECGAGAKYCEDGSFGECVLTTTPVEVCTPSDMIMSGAAAADEDCDGLIDEGCISDSCMPQDERCDGIDNDCDGEIDNLLTPPPSIQQLGVCSGGVQICKGTAGWAEPDLSLVQGYEATEVSCDGLDNDCDGAIDNNLTPPPATLQTGVCSALEPICGGVQSWLQPDYEQLEYFQAVETECDRQDNDCDGEIDEGCGVCQPSPEVCDGRDNDCDGVVDDGLDAPLTSLQVGICIGARQICLGLDGWVEPQLSQLPGFEEGDESCNDLDNDCDGDIDEGCCQPTEEVCDGVDNNCNGLIDEHAGFECLTEVDGCEGEYLGVWTCLGDEGECVPVEQPDPDADELCDGLDNDCDGEIDEEANCGLLIHDHCSVSLAWGYIPGDQSNADWSQFPPVESGEGCVMGSDVNAALYGCDTASRSPGFEVININRASILTTDDWIGIAWHCEANAGSQLTPGEVERLNWANDHCHVALGYRDFYSASGVRDLNPEDCPTYSPYPGQQFVSRCIQTDGSLTYSALELEGGVNWDDKFGIAFYCESQSEEEALVAEQIHDQFVVYFATYQGGNSKTDGVLYWGQLPEDSRDNWGNSKGVASPIETEFRTFNLENDLASPDQLSISTGLR